MSRTMKHSGVDWLGEIPADWNCDKVFRIFQTIGSGTTPKSENPDYYNGNVNWIQSGDINGGFLTDTKIFVTDEAVKKFSALKIYEAPFIIMAMYGASIGNLSMSNINACVNQACCVMQNGRQNIRYSFYALKVAKEYLVWKAVGGGQPNISQDTIKQLWLPFPPPDEQQRIASFLDDKCARIDSVIEKTRTSVEEYKKLKQALITRAVTKGIRPARPMKDSGIEWLGDIPADWKIGRIGHLYTERKEKVSDVDFPPLSVTMKGILPQLSTAAKSDAHDDRKLVRKGDFAINSRSDRRGSCGISPYDGSVSLINIILTPREEIHPVYYDWLFHSTMFADEFYKWGHGIVDDLWTTNWQEMKKISVPVPPLDEQKEIAQYLDEKTAAIDSLIARKNQLVTELESLKKSLIFEYVTGKKEII